MNKITHTWSLMSACWRLLLKDKELLLFPLISGICCLLVMASFALPIYFTGSWEAPKAEATLHQVIYLIGLALVQSALQSIFQAAIYLYARDGQVPDGFQAEFLSGAIAER